MPPQLPVMGQEARTPSNARVVLVVVFGLLALVAGTAVLGCAGLFWLAHSARQNLVAAAAAAQASAVKLIETPNITYVERDGKPLKLDLFQPQEMKQPLPLVVCIHGGGWQSGNKEAFAGFARYFAQNGFIAVSVQYRLAPAARYPAQIEDVRSAIRWLRANADKYQIIKEQVGVVGGSAGGHLALLAGLMDDPSDPPADDPHADESCKAQAIVNYFGPADFGKQDWPPVVEKMLENLMGGDRTKLAKEFAAASPVSHIDAHDPPVLTFHGTADALVPYNQATGLHAALKEAGVQNELETLTGEGHGFSPGQWVRTLEMSQRFLTEILVEGAEEELTPLPTK
ncbi:MAG: alpha/beta fold hydrolase [Pirellulales bacterium]